jgi:uncharacterized repeat protein (TIGR03803 family)
MRYHVVVFLLVILTSAILAQDSGPSLTTLYSFTGPDGSYPEAGVLIASSGALYGTTVQGGSGKRGTFYVLKPPTGSGGWTETVLFNFGGTGEPWTPFGLTPGKGGSMYGAAAAGGKFSSGAVFKLKPPASPGADWTEGTIYNFGHTTADGIAPNGSLVLSKSGVLYGTTKGGGDLAGDGAVFALTPPASGSGAWTETILHRFSSTGKGMYGPRAGLIIGAGGVLYGTTCCGGAANYGAVFKLTPPSESGGSWTTAVLYSFKGGTDGANPMAVLMMGKSGALYGTTKLGGTANLGTVFELAPPSPPSDDWTETVLYSFAGGSDGSYPEAGLLKVASGTMYGTTSRGGAAGLGTVFKMKPSAEGTWTESVVDIFGADNGAVPMAGLAQSTSGALYGTTEFGGSTGDGTVFKLIP